MSEVFFQQLPIGPMANYVYLVGDPSKKEAAVVDPAWDVPAILKAAGEKGYRITAAVCTHNHFDHVNGLEDLLKAADIPVYVNEKDASAVKAAGGNLRKAAGGDVVRVGSVEITLLHTPGHTAGSQCLKVGERLITGDTLFVEGCGRVDLPTSDPAQMYESLRKISTLPPETVIWPGHNYAEDPSSPLSRQLAKNPYLKVSATQGLPVFLQLIGG